MRCSSESVTKRVSLQRCSWALVFLAAALLMSGCAHWRSVDNPAEMAARRTLTRLQTVNAGLSDCKGLGQVTLRTGSKSQHARLAWAAKIPDQLRLELLAVSGHPLAALASDGSHLYLRDSTSDRFHKSNSPQANLEQLVQVPLRVPDLIAYLMGRTPAVAAERMVQMDNPHEPGYILELSRWWGAISQRIFLNPDRKTITRVVNFAAEGKVAYLVDLADHRSEGEFLFAHRLSAFTPEGNRIDIRLERFWPNAGIDGGAFHLSR